MPRRLIIVGCLFCLLAVGALAELALDLLRGDHIVFNTGLLMLPIGVGLLRRRQLARLLATYTLALTAVLGVIGAGVVALERSAAAELSRFGPQLTGAPAAAAISIMLLTLAVGSMLLVRMLYTPPVSLAFDRSASGSATADQGGSGGSGQPA